MQSYFQNQQGFVAFIKDGNICDPYGQQVGVVNDKYNKAIETAKGYEKVLYDKGILTKPKTAEEINQELQSTLKQTQAMMLEMSNTISALNEKVNKLEDNDVKQTINGSGCTKIAGAKGGGSIQPNI